MDLYFKPKPGGFKDNLLRVQPDILPPGYAKISEVWIEEQPYSDFDADNLIVKLPFTHEELKVRVRLIPTQIVFDATPLKVIDGTAKLALSGMLDVRAVERFQEAIEQIAAQPIKRLVLLLDNLQCISSTGMRALIFTKQKLGSEIDIYIVGASETHQEVLQNEHL